MLSVNRIDTAESICRKRNNNMSFKSKFEPNFALKCAFEKAKDDCKIAIWNKNYFYAGECIDKAGAFARIIDHLLNDKKNDLIKVTMSKKNCSSALFINSKRVNTIEEDYKYYRDLPKENIIDYYTNKTNDVADKTKLSYKEFKVMQPDIDILNAQLNGDDAAKNPDILHNLGNNLSNLYTNFARYTLERIEKFEAQIFKA